PPPKSTLETPRLCLGRLDARGGRRSRSRCAARMWRSIRRGWWPGRAGRRSSGRRTRSRSHGLTGALRLTTRGLRLLLLPGALLLHEARVGRQNHEQHPAFEARGLLDDRDVLQLGLDAAQDGLPDLAVRDLTAAEHHGHARLVALGEELADRLRLEGVIVLFRLGTELHFLELHDRLLLLRLARLLLGLVLELAVVHDLADRRLGHGRDLDQVETELLGLGEGGLEGDHSQLLT